jgi:hypothetical protein
MGIAVTLNSILSALYLTPSSLKRASLRQVLFQ